MGAGSLKHAVNTSVYAWLRHPWLRTVSESRPPPALSAKELPSFSVAQSGLILLIQKLLSIKCRHATEACGSHSLAVNVVGYVAGGKYARDAALGGHAFQT